MEKVFIVFTSAAMALSIARVALADDEFHGIIESRPDGKAGTWVVGGRSVKVTEHTELDEDHGPLRVGACANVEIDQGVVEEIESEPTSKCAR